MKYNKIIHDNLNVDIIDENSIVVRSFGPFINNDELDLYINDYINNLNEGTITLNMDEDETTNS